MRRLSILAPFMAAVMVLGTISVASAAGKTPSLGVSVFHGFVMVDGKPAPAGTIVKMKLKDGTLVGTTVTGGAGLAANQYRMDVQATAAMQGKPVYFKAGSAKGNLASVTFWNGRAMPVDLAGSSARQVEWWSAAHSTSSQEAGAWGVAVFHGGVTLDGAAAPKGTTVTMMANGQAVPSAQTGASGLGANQYRMDVQPSNALQGKTVTFHVGNKNVGSATFWANRAVSLDLMNAASAGDSSGWTHYGVAVFHGFVNVGGKPAAAGTKVKLVHKATGAVVTTATTGGNGLLPNQYRFDVQSGAALHDSEVQVVVGSTSVSAMFWANRVMSVDVSAW